MNKKKLQAMKQKRRCKKRRIHLRRNHQNLVAAGLLLPLSSFSQGLSFSLFLSFYPR
ncbi:unnamed protein product [Arabidopsis halleri]